MTTASSEVISSIIPTVAQREAIAALAGVHTRTVRRYYRGHSSLGPTHKLISDAAQRLGLPSPPPPRGRRAR